MAYDVIFRSLILAAASLLTSAQGDPPSAAAPLGKFSDFPNVSVTYYNVTGNNVRAVHGSIKAHAPLDPITKKPTPAILEWSIEAKVHTSTSSGQCTIDSVKLRFAGNAQMPRLMAPADGPPSSAELLATWVSFSAQLEGRQIAQLRFAYDRLDQIEREIRASNCRNWKAATREAIERLKREQAEARSRDKTPPPKLVIPKKELDEEGVVVKQLPS